MLFTYYTNIIFSSLLPLLRRYILCRHYYLPFTMLRHCRFHYASSATQHYFIFATLMRANESARYGDVYYAR